MSCERYDEDIVALARGEDVEQSARRGVLAHVRDCGRCAVRLDEERAVTSALGSFATRTAGAQAPPRVEWALVRALREPAAPDEVKGAPSRIFDLLLLAAAAVIVAAIVMVPPRFEASLAPDSVPAAGAVATTAAAPETEESGGFVALRYGEDLGELDSLQVVSVELPHTALAALGLPPDEGAGEMVRAEVIVGHDGVARAIRFVD